MITLFYFIEYKKVTGCLPHMDQLICAHCVCARSGRLRPNAPLTFKKPRAFVDQESVM
jgi:hypothetical protein